MAIQTQQQNDVVFTDSKIDLIRRVFCKGATNDEMELFIEICKKTRLDPVFKQIHFTKPGGTMVTITGIDGFRLIAERTGRYMPGREATFTYDKAGNLFSATSYVKKFGPDNQWHEIAATCILKEYKKGNNWNTMPHAMLAKCSEALAIRRAFPADLSGLYTKEEMDQAEPTELAFKPEEPGTITVQPSAPVEVIAPDMAALFESQIKTDDAGFKTYLLNHISGLAKTKIESIKAIPKSLQGDCAYMIEQRVKQYDEIEKQKQTQDW